MSSYSQVPPKERLPEWIRTPIGNATELESDAITQIHVKARLN